MGALFVLIGLLFVFCIAYPVFGVIIAKLGGSKKTVRQIISEL